MWTPEESAIYRANQQEGKLAAEALGREMAQLLHDKKRPITKESNPHLKGIDSLYQPLVIEPLLAETDYGYENLGSVFKNTIDLYVGRKCAKIIPLLLAVAENLHKHDAKSVSSAFEGGGADHWYWVTTYTPWSGVAGSVPHGRINMQWNTQSRSYHVDMTMNASEQWKLYVVERKINKPRKSAKQSWMKEPGYVLEYLSKGKDILTEPHYLIDDKSVDNAWLNIKRINRWMDLINTVCTSLDVRLYNPPFHNRQVVTLKEIP